MSVVNAASKSNSCTYYGKGYHTEENCYKKHGYHPNFSSNREGAGGWKRGGEIEVEGWGGMGRVQQKGEREKEFDKKWWHHSN